MSSGKGNPFWRVGKKGHGLARLPGVPVVEERGDVPAGDRPAPIFPDRDWIGPKNQGGGTIPAADNWQRSPKERQDRLMGDSQRKVR
ncbi:MAG: hypothetical protein ACYCWW_02680 [Deltaproteobacteria bacterium]